MDYEKKYKEALELARDYYKANLKLYKADENVILEFIFPELLDEDERIRKELIKEINGLWENDSATWPSSLEKKNKYIAWLEKQGEKRSAIRWYDVSLIPKEMEELLVEWDSEDATWHEIAFYHADTKTFWNGTRQVENVKRWCYIIDLLEKQGEQKVSYTTLVKTGDGGINALVTKELPAEDCDDEQKPVDEAEPKFHIGDKIRIFRKGTANEEPMTITKIDGKGYWSGDLFLCNFTDADRLKLVERKPADNVKPKFHKGEWVVTSYGKVNQVIAVDEDGDGFTLDDDTYFSGSWCDMYHRWTIQDAKDGDVLYSPCLELLWIFKNRDSVYCGCNLSYNNGAFCGEGYFKMPTDAIPATKEQHDTLMKAMTDAGWEFDFDKKELKKISQRMVSAEAKEAMYDKPTDEEMKELLRTEYEKGRADAIAEMQKGWSEEDERNLRLTEYAVMKFFGGDCSLVGWLRKSLKDRYTWKPSEEQMKVLLSEVTAWTKGCPKQKVLESLYNDLKKLMEK